MMINPRSLARPASEAKAGDFVVLKGSKYDVCKVLRVDEKGIYAEYLTSHWITTAGYIKSDVVQNMEIVHPTLGRHQSIRDRIGILEKHKSTYPAMVLPHSMTGRNPSSANPMKLSFSVIYSIDADENVKLSDYYPYPNIRRKLVKTEGNESYDLGYLGGAWKKGKHIKLAGVLTEKEFSDFRNSTPLRYDGEGGAIGAPGTGYGASTGFAFTDDNEYDAVLHAIAVPLISGTKVTPTDAMWRRIRNYAMRKYVA